MIAGAGRAKAPVLAMRPERWARANWITGRAFRSVFKGYTRRRPAISRRVTRVADRAYFGVARFALGGMRDGLFFFSVVSSRRMNVGLAWSRGTSPIHFCTTSRRTWVAAIAVRTTRNARASQLSCRRGEGGNHLAGCGRLYAVRNRRTGNHFIDRAADSLDQISGNLIGERGEDHSAAACSTVSPSSMGLFNVIVHRIKVSQ